MKYLKIQTLFMQLKRSCAIVIRLNIIFIKDKLILYSFYVVSLPYKI